jgi:hypothetical protein
MGQFVLEIGSTSLESLRTIVERNLTEQSSLHVLAWEHRESMTYTPSAIPLSDVIQGLAAQSFASAMWRDIGGAIRYMLLYCPHFSNSNLGLWVCTVEYTTEAWTVSWDELGTDINLRFACVSQDEGLILSDDQLSPDTFPWSDRALLAAAVRSASGEWVSREAAKV